MLDNTIQYQYNTYPQRNNSTLKLNEVNQYNDYNKPASSVRFGKDSSFSLLPSLPIPFITNIKDPKDKMMYKVVSDSLDSKEKSKLKSLLKTGKLLSRNSNNKSSTLENLYIVAQRSQSSNRTAEQKHEDKLILNETVRTIHNPFLINQNFGKIPDALVSKIIASKNNPTQSENQEQNPQISPQDIDVQASGTCVAASIEFNLADKKPAEFARYVAGLTGPQKSVKVNIKTTDIASNIFEAHNILKEFGTEHKIKDWHNIEVTLRPDENAFLREKIQEYYRQPGSRSPIDVLLQSTFMELGSANTYNTLTDNRAGDNAFDDKGLIAEEKNYAESVIDNNSGGKSSVTYQIVDDEGYLKGQDTSSQVIQSHLLRSLAMGKNVIIGITETDNTGKIIGGHEITVIGVDKKEAKKGHIVFECNDTDDEYAGKVKIDAKYLIPKIHHAGIPDKVLGISVQDSPYNYLDLINNMDAPPSYSQEMEDVPPAYEQTAQATNVQQPVNYKLEAPPSYQQSVQAYPNNQQHYTMPADKPPSYDQISPNSFYNQADIKNSRMANNQYPQPYQSQQV